MLEHLLEHHFTAPLGAVEELALAKPLFGDMFLQCWQLGQAEEPGNAQRFQALRVRLQKGPEPKPTPAPTAHAPDGPRGRHRTRRTEEKMYR